MKLADLGEFAFIRRITENCICRPEGVVLGPGDDAAAVKGQEGDVLLMTTDLLVERVHFRREWMTGRQVGYKAMAVNLSDIAAMGGIAREALVSWAVAGLEDLAYLEEIYAGMRALAQQYQVNILGGDTTRSPDGLMLNVAILGVVPLDQMLRRGGASPGDVLVLAGSLGESRAGLFSLMAGVDPRSPKHERLMAAHLEPVPRLREGRFFAMSGAAHAAIDLSDGLSSDLGHVIQASQVGARVFADRLPISKQVREYCQSQSLDPVEFALAGGEDYSLLVAIREESAEDLKREFDASFQEPLSCIGEITDTGRLELIHPNGRTIELLPSGWDHFS